MIKCVTGSYILQQLGHMRGAGKQNKTKRRSVCPEEQIANQYIFEHIRSVSVTEPRYESGANQQANWMDYRPSCILPAISAKEFKLNSSYQQIHKINRKQIKIPSLIHYQSQKNIQATRAKQDSENGLNLKKFYIQTIKLIQESKRKINMNMGIQSKMKLKPLKDDLCVEVRRQNSIKLIKQLPEQILAKRMMFDGKIREKRIYDITSDIQCRRYNSKRTDKCQRYNEVSCRAGRQKIIRPSYSFDFKSVLILYI